MKDFYKIGSLIGIVAEFLLAVFFLASPEHLEPYSLLIIAVLGVADAIGWAILWSYADNHEPDSLHLTWIGGPIGRVFAWFMFFVDLSEKAEPVDLRAKYGTPRSGTKAPRGPLRPPKFMELH